MVKNKSQGLVFVHVLIIAMVICVLNIWLCRRYVVRVVSAVDDVLERILARELSPPMATSHEDRISKLTHKANRITRMLTDETTRAKAEKETVQGFISDLSHQMKTPLSGIAMYTELMLEPDITYENTQEFLSRVKISVDKLQWMTDSLIKLSRLETGIIALNVTRTGIRDTIMQAVTLVQGEAYRHDITVIVNDFKDLPLCHDKKWTVEAIVNILDNAVKYSPTGGVITVDMTLLQQYVKIVISDTGIGIPKEEWNKIFKRFYRGQNVKDKEGVGLGLYLVRVIMESQGGYVMVGADKEIGTDFSLFLPCNTLQV